eukprot:scaffold7247_cov484-Prasinococcus_capsulatus_cf.AAC.1
MDCLLGRCFSSPALAFARALLDLHARTKCKDARHVIASSHPRWANPASESSRTGSTHFSRSCVGRNTYPFSLPKTRAVTLPTALLMSLSARRDPPLPAPLPLSWALFSPFCAS